jgi:hypothetical protein
VAADAVFGTPDRYRPGFVAAELGEENTDLPDATRLLAADGWRVGEPDDRAVTAARGGWRLTLDNGGDFVYGTHDSPVATLRVERTPIRLAVVLSVLAWLLGGVVSWFKPDRLASGFAGPLLLIFNTVVAAVGVIRGVVAVFGTGSFPVPWEAFELFLMRPISIVGVVVLVVHLVTPARIRAAAGRRARSLRGR